MSFNALGAYQVLQMLITFQVQIASISNKNDLHQIRQWIQIKGKHGTIFVQYGHCTQQNVQIFDFRYKSAPSSQQLSSENEECRKLDSGRIVNDILWQSFKNITIGIFIIKHVLIIELNQLLGKNL